MRFLLDTHILLWVQSNDPALSATARGILNDADNQFYVSHLNFMEIAIKHKLGKLPAFKTSVNTIIRQAAADGFLLLPVSNRHIEAYERIPLHDDHRDPFDRLLLATALSEQMPIISADEKFKRYQDVVEVID